MFVKKILFGFLFFLPFFIQAQVIENFDAFADYSAFSLLYDDTADGGIYVTKEITSNNAYSGKCLHYIYNLTNAWENIKITAWTPTNWASYYSVSFWIKGTPNVEKVAFLFKETDDKDEWLYEYTGITTNWQKVIIPLEQANWTYVDWDSDGGSSNLTHDGITNWSMFFETATGNITNAQVWIDEIKGATNIIAEDYSLNSYNDYYDFVAAGHSEYSDPSASFISKEITTNQAYEGKSLHYIYSINTANDTIGFINNNSTNFSFGN